MKLLSRHRRALPRAQFETLRDALLTSPLVGKSTLTGTFESSRGFAMTFRGDEGRHAVTARFSVLAPWFQKSLGEPAVRSMTPLFERPFRRPHRIPNAWYLNVLLVRPGGAVARHLDVTLRGPAEVEDAAPEVVSVLYLRVPPKSTGGALRLWAGKRDVATVTPRENTTVHFRGDLAHAVEPLTASEPEMLRASLVLEQYHFEEAALARLPVFQLDSRAGFEAFMNVHRQASPKQFDFEE